MHNLPIAVLPPEAGLQHNQKGEDFQTANKHDDAADYLGHFRQIAEIIRCTKGNASVTHTGNPQQDSINHRQSVKAKDAGC